MTLPKAISHPPTDAELRALAEHIVDTCAELQKKVLVKHTVGLLRAMYEQVNAAKGEPS